MRVDATVGESMVISQTMQQVGDRFGRTYSFDPATILIAIQVFLKIMEACDAKPSDLRSIPRPVLVRRIRLGVRKQTTFDQWREVGNDLCDAMVDYVDDPSNDQELVTAFAEAKRQA